MPFEKLRETKNFRIFSREMPNGVCVLCIECMVPGTGTGTSSS